MSWSEQMTLAHLAYMLGWPTGEARDRVRPLVSEGRVMRRRVPVAAASPKRRVVYQLCLMKQKKLKKLK